MADKSDTKPPKSADEGPSPADNAGDPSAAGADSETDNPLIVNGQYIKGSFLRGADNAWYFRPHSAGPSRRQH